VQASNMPLGCCLVKDHGMWLGIEPHPAVAKRSSNPREPGVAIALDLFLSTNYLTKVLITVTEKYDCCRRQAVALNR
jgi:hypothetical protein